MVQDGSHFSKLHAKDWDKSQASDEGKKSTLTGETKGEISICHVFEMKDGV